MDRSDGRGWLWRAQIMLRHTWLLTIAACLLMAGVLAVSFYYASRPTTLNIAVSSSNGEDVKLVQAIALQFTRDRANIRLRPVIEVGPAESAAAIDAETADLAIVRHDVAMPKSGLAVAVLRQNVVVMIVPAAGSVAHPESTKPIGEKAKAPEAKKSVKAGKAAKGKKGAEAAKADSGEKATGGEKSDTIEKVDQFVGRRIGVIGSGGSRANIAVLNVILKQYEISPEKVTIVPLDANDVRTSLKGHPVDVIFAVGPVTRRFITDAIAASTAGKKQPSFIAIDASEAIASRLSVYESAELKTGVFGGSKPLPGDTVKTIAFNHYIVAHRSISEANIADFTRLLFGVRQNLARDYPAITKLEKPDTDKDAAVPAHPGAAAFIGNEQKTFFDRYNDLLYWALMIISILGSGIVWVTSYFKADDRIRRMKVLDHLLDVVKTARRVETIEEIENLRADVDEILNKTLQQVEKNDLDESALIAFSLALDQAQLAISDRRAILLARHQIELPIESSSAVRRFTVRR